MKIVAISIGSYGDVQPFIVLGKYMKAQGHDFTVAALKEFRDNVEGEGLCFCQMHGDLGELVCSMLADSDNSTHSGTNGIMSMLSDKEAIYQSYEGAIKGKDLVIFMQFSDVAIYFAEKYRVKCVRSYVFPNDPTPQFNPLFSKSRENSWITYLDYKLADYFMERSKKECSQYICDKLDIDYKSCLKKFKKSSVLTLYQYSEVLAPKYKRWGTNIYITGPWYEDEKDYEPEDELKDFVKSKEKPLYIGFGSMNYSKLNELGEIVRQAVLKSGYRAIIASNLNPNRIYENDDRIHYVDYIPFGWLFDNVCGVIQHGGCGTVHYAMRYGVPTLVLSFGADQYFWGRRIHSNGAGPMPLDIKKDDITAEILAIRIGKLVSDTYRRKAQIISRKMQHEQGYKTAAKLIENWEVKG